MTGTTGHREADRLAGAISQDIYDEFCQRWNLRFGGEDYELLGEENAEFTALGYDGSEGGALILRRKRDGQLFEVELEASVRIPMTAAEREAWAQYMTGQRMFSGPPGVGARP